MGTGYERPGRGFYINAPAECKHGDVIVAGGVPGSVIKQRGYSTRTTLPEDFDTVASGERIFLRTKGVCEIDALVSADPGDPVYIDPDDFTTSLTQAGNAVILGRVTDTPGVHGCPTGINRVDMDLKDGV